jgi:hypothetical protein
MCVCVCVCVCVYYDGREGRSSGNINTVHIQTFFQVRGRPFFLVSDFSLPRHAGGCFESRFRHHSLVFYPGIKHRMLLEHQFEGSRGVALPWTNLFGSDVRVVGYVAKTSTVDGDPAWRKTVRDSLPSDISRHLRVWAFKTGRERFTARCVDLNAVRTR